jgi:hypothetical protein
MLFCVFVGWEMDGEQKGAGEVVDNTYKIIKKS